MTACWQPEGAGSGKKVGAHDKNNLKDNSEMNLKSIAAMAAALIMTACAGGVSEKNNGSDPMPSWNDTPVKKQIVDYLEEQSAQIPEEDRIAVLDMDGTIICEHPLWCEMAVASQKMADRLKENPGLAKYKSYLYAEKLTKNPSDTSVINNWFADGNNYLDSIIYRAFDGVSQEEYVSYARKYIMETPIRKYDIPYGEAFYKPMLELIDYLRSKKFDVYIVSGSMQGMVWAAVPEELGFDRQHLIGSCQQTVVKYGKDGASFVIQNDVLQPKNNGDGKSINIFNRLGKIPVVAIGNTTGDFGMFRLASTSRYPHFAMMINHDDAEREFKYNPYYDKVKPAWEDTVRANGWIQADMSKEFKVVFDIEKN